MCIILESERFYSRLTYLNSLQYYRRFIAQTWKDVPRCVAFITWRKFYARNQVLKNRENFYAVVRRNVRTLTRTFDAWIRAREAWRRERCTIVYKNESVCRLYMRAWCEAHALMVRMRRCVARLYNRVCVHVCRSWYAYVCGGRRMRHVCMRIVQRMDVNVTIRMFDAWSQRALAALRANKRAIFAVFRAWSRLNFAGNHALLALRRIYILPHMHAWMRTHRRRMRARHYVSRYRVRFTGWVFDSWAEHVHVRKERMVWCDMLQRMP
jgi:hypothetical protein